MYQTYEDAPIVLVYDEDQNLLKNIPFPAITINSEVRMDVYHRSAINSIIFGIVASGISSERATDIFIRNIQREGKYDKLFTEALLCRDKHLANEITLTSESPALKDLIETVKNASEIEWFKKNEVKWNSRFTPEFIEILAFPGYSFAFNMLEPSKLFKNKYVFNLTIILHLNSVSKFYFSMTDDFKNSRKFFTNSKGIPVLSRKYPLRTSAKETDGLSVTINRDPLKRDNELCKTSNFIVHSPYELTASYRKVETYDFFFGYDFTVLISPKVIKTDDDLRKFSPEKRECYFNGEKELKYFKVYTRRNCELECATEFTLRYKYMKCVPFHYARNSSSALCDHRHERYRNNNEIYFYFDKYHQKCKCFPSCNSVEYKVEVSPLERNDYNFKQSWRGKYDAEQEITFRYKDDEIHYTRRKLAMTFNDFLAQSGGLMGLFAGISILSLIEIFYFFTLRVMTNILHKFK